MTDGENAPVAAGADTEHKDRGPKRSDLVGTALLGVVGLVAVVMGLNYGFSQENGQVGPGFLPVMTGGFIVVASALELIRMLVAPTSSVEGGWMQAVERVESEALSAVSSHGAGGSTAGRSQDATTDGLDTFGRTHAQSRMAVVLIFGVMLAAILLIPVLGLLLSMSLMVFVLLRFIEGKGWLLSLAVSLVALAAFFLIFKQALGVPLPTGMLGLV